VRDVQGRLGRLVCSVVVGLLSAVTIAIVLPQRSLNGWGAGAFGLTNPLLVASGAVGITMAMNAWLAAIARRPSRVRIDVPRATVVRRRAQS